MSHNSYTLLLSAGMGNRLRKLMKYIFICERDKLMPLYVLWNKSSGTCNAHFLDLFEPLDGVIFKKNPNSKNIRKFPDFSFQPNDKEIWTNIYSRLKPKIEYHSQIDSIISQLGKQYISIHVRRTDQLKSFATTDNDFFEYIDKFPSNYNIFLATENSATQRIFKKRYKDRVIWSKNIVGNSNRPIPITRDGSIVMDIFVSSKAENFKGSYYSSFSTTIRRLRYANNEGPSE